MDRTEFKKRMQSLKSYREQNPDKGYWDWRASLPDNLRYTDDTEYDMRGAYESGAQPKLEDDGLYHLPTRDPKSGKILKKSIHPTYFKGLTVDSELGYKPYFFGGETYTWNDQDGAFVPWQKVEQFQDGGGTTDYNKGLLKYSTGAKILNFLRQIFNKDYRTPETSKNMHRTMLDVHTAQYGNIDEDFVPGDVFFLPEDKQKQVMEKHGYSKVIPLSEIDRSDQYGLVRTAANKLRDQGKEVPIYQDNRYSDSNVSRSDVELIPTVKDIYSYNALDRLSMAGNHPVRYYMNKNTGQVYIRGWDLNDYGIEGTNSGGAAAEYNLIQRSAADWMDRNGFPFVQTSGFVPIDSTLQYADSVVNSYNGIAPNPADRENAIKYLHAKYLQSFRGSKTKKAIEEYKKSRGFSEGGEVPPSDYQGSNEPARVNPITGKPLANGAVTPVLDLEEAANFTSVGDVLSIRDMYVAARNRDLLGLGLAGLGILPFMSRIRPIDRPPIPTVNKDAIQRQIDLSVSQTDKNKKVLDDFYDQRNRVYESLIENEDAFRRAAKADRKSGTSYMQTYQDMVREYGRDGSNLNPNLAQPGYDRSLYEQPVKAQVSTSNPDLIRLNPRYKDPEELDETFQSLNPGLIRHEMGHSTDIKSGLDYTKSLADPSKFEPESRIKEMYPKSYKTIQDYLLNGSEIKSHMNEFRDFLFNKDEYQPKETINSIRKKLDKYGSQFKNLNILFDLYKNKRQFVNDYNLIPITATENNDNLV